MSEFSDTGGDRTELPTPQRIENAREEGFVAKSTDLTAAVVLVVGLGMLAMFGPGLFGAMRVMTTTLLDGQAAPLADPAALEAATWQAASGLIVPVLGVLIGCVLAAVATGVAQVRPLFASGAIAPRGSRISVAQGLRRIVSGRSAFRGLMTILKLALGAAVVAGCLETVWRVSAAAFSGADSADAMVTAVGGAMAAALWWMAGGLVLLGVLDWLFQRWQYTQDLKMTRQAWREDIKQTQGDPRMRAQRRDEVRRVSMADGVGRNEASDHGE